MAKRPEFRFNDIHGFLQSLFGEDMHAKRVLSLANATLGVMTSASLAVHAIGLGLAQARGLCVGPLPRRELADMMPEGRAPRSPAGP